jgi:hypothetical protein
MDVRPWFRTFLGYLGLSWPTVKELLEAQAVEWMKKHPRPRTNPCIIVDSFETTFSNAHDAFEASINDNLQSHEVSEPLHAPHMEFNHGGPQNVFSMISPSFQNLETCVITGGWPRGDPPLEDILYALLPVAKTLRTLIYRPRWH